jgi:hypothetical protein
VTEGLLREAQEVIGDATEVAREQAAAVPARGG